MDEVLATVNFATEKATVTVPPSVRVDQLIGEIEQAGYGAEVLAPAAAGGAPDAARVAYLRRRLIVAVVFFVPLSDMSVLLSLFPAYRFPGWQWVLIALAAPVAAWAAWPFHQAALRNARHGSSSMDTLVSLGIIAACGSQSRQDSRLASARHTGATACPGWPPPGFLIGAADQESG